MRNNDLDKKLSIDNKIGELKSDKNGQYRIIKGKKIYQIKEKTQADKDFNLLINRCRVLGIKPSQYLLTLQIR